MVNVGALGVGEVEVVRDGKMVRAAVRRAVDAAEGTYELSLWTEVSLGNQSTGGVRHVEPVLVTVAAA